MKKGLFIFLVLHCLTTYAQNLNFSDLLYLKNNSLNKVEEYLIKRNWKFDSFTPVDGADFSQASFVYYDAKGLGNLAYLTYVFSQTDTEVQLTFFKKEKYFEYLNEVKALKSELISTRTTKESGLQKVYQSGKNIYIFQVNKVDYEDISLPSWNLILTYLLDE